MCQLIYLASAEALDKSEIGLRDANDMWEKCQNVRKALPAARYFYQLGACQCHFRYSTEEEISRLEAGFAGWRSYLEGYNAFIPRVARFLEQNCPYTRVWLFSVWEGEEDHPALNRWACSPACFLRPDFLLPDGRSVIEILPEGVPELTPLERRGTASSG